MLHDLAKLRLDKRPVLAEKEKNTLAVGQDRKPQAGSDQKTGKQSDESDGPTAPEPPKNLPQTPVRIKKATRLEKLRLSILSSTDNASLSNIVVEFNALLKDTGSKTLTREGFAFLDALYKQLTDPSVFIQPMRTRSAIEQVDGENRPVRVKLGVIARLREDVMTAQSNRMLAKLVADFGAVTNKSSARTITKDGFAFLDGLADRLKVLS